MLCVWPRLDQQLDDRSLLNLSTERPSRRTAIRSLIQKFIGYDHDGVRYATYQVSATAFPPSNALSNFMSTDIRHNMDVEHRNPFSFIRASSCITQRFWRHTWLVMDPVQVC